MKELWIRIGAVIRITDDEEQDIFADNEEKMRDALRRVVAEGRFCPDGETYVPKEPVRGSPEGGRVGKGGDSGW